MHSAKSAQQGHVFLASGVEFSVTPHPAATERITLNVMPIPDAYAMLHAGEILDCQSAMSLLVCERVLRERGLLV
jgi:hypothetical protein